MKVLSLFDGISCGQSALKKAGIPVEIYYASEIDKYAISITQHNFPNTVQLGDVTNWRNWNIDWKSIDLLIGGSPCFAAGTFVMTNKGNKPIEYVEVGDKVLTHTGKFKTVLKTGHKISNDIYKVQGMGVDYIITTGEHPFYTKKRAKVGHQRVQLLKSTWTMVKNLKIKTHYLGGTSIVDKTVVDTNTNSLDYWYYIGTTVVVKNKMPEEVWTLSKEKKEAVLKGIIFMGGFKDGHSTQLNVLNRDVVYDIKQLVLEVYGVVAWIKLYNTKKLDRLGLKFSKNPLVSMFVKDGQYTWSPVKAITKLKTSQMVYNLEVEDDNSYVVNGVIVHNCQSFSACGKREGFDGKSKLFWEFRDVLNHVKQANPNVKFLLENVKMKKEWENIITNEIGVAPQLINAALVSAQNRNRNYWTNISDNVTLNVNVNDMTLKDILEDEVDEKYILTLEQLPRIDFDGANKDFKTFIHIIGHRLNFRRNTQVYLIDGKTETIDCATGGGRQAYVLLSNGDSFKMPNGKIAKLPKEYIDKQFCFKEVRTEEGKLIRRTIRQQTGRDTTLRGKQYKQFEPNINNKMNCLTTSIGADNIITQPYLNEYVIRKLTPVEYERLMTLDDNYTKYGVVNNNIVEISDSQRYKCCGNGWSVDVIAHILKCML